MENHIEIYKSNKDNVEIQVQFEKETVWLNQYQLADLFDTDRTSVLKHIQNIYMQLMNLMKLQLVQNLHKFEKKEIEK